MEAKPKTPSRVGFAIAGVKRTSVREMYGPNDNARDGVLLRIHNGANDFRAAVIAKLVGLRARAVIHFVARLNA